MKKTAKIFYAILIVLLIASAICNVVVIVGNQTYSVVLRCLSGVALIATASALYYLLRGFSKNSAPAYKAFMIICAVYFQAICCANAVTSDQYANKLSSGLFALSNSLLFGLFLLLGVAKDMGKKQTFAIGVISIVLTLLALVECIFWDKSGLAPGLGLMLLTRVVTRFILAAVACFMAYFKYLDKEARGTK